MILLNQCKMAMTIKRQISHSLLLTTCCLAELDSALSCDGDLGGSPPWGCAQSDPAVAACKKAAILLRVAFCSLTTSFCWRSRPAKRSQAARQRRSKVARWCDTAWTCFLYKKISMKYSQNVLLLLLSTTLPNYYWLTIKRFSSFLLTPLWKNVGFSKIKFYKCSRF